jgi:hypothetical protein
MTIMERTYSVYTLMFMLQAFNTVVSEKIAFILLHACNILVSVYLRSWGVRGSVVD